MYQYCEITTPIYH